jgi:hypothetical protein
MGVKLPKLMRKASWVIVFSPLEPAIKEREVAKGNQLRFPTTKRAKQNIPIAPRKAIEKSVTSCSVATHSAKAPRIGRNVLEGYVRSLYT